ncbi:MAG: gliding motility-associated C-terminal domain-containing protein [Bacteroidia bacterium]|nr:gliding motility-associated C-terminal domain-containing protein [Bacteroidia bacterium]MDW8345767.1 gliding motility-associated C-terminal domain-containing protein [Bacteroidia bacterium]
MLLLLSNLPAHNPDEKIFFIPNQGQWEEHFSYKANLQGGTVFLHDKSWRFCLIHPEDTRKMHPNPNPDTVLLRHHAFEIEFLNTNTAALKGHQPAPHYHNYYLGNNPDRWKTNIPLYEKVSYSNVYPKIDLVVYSENLHLKYDWIVQPGGNPNFIQLAYKGLDRLYLKNGHLYMITSIGELIEQKPYAYQIKNNIKQNIPCRFVLNKNIVSYEFPEGYSSDTPLIIDPVMVFASYTGSFANNWGFTATYDNAGNAYAGGVAFEPGYPITLGAFQTTWAGTSSTDFYDRMDIAISKFNANGTNLLYSTYIGGTLREQPHSMITDDAYNLYVFGTTNSTNFPTTTSAYDNTFNGGDRDIIVFKFNSSGTVLLGSTYLGGSGADGSISSAASPTSSSLYKNYGDDVRGEIILDVYGNIYVATSTGSLNIPKVKAQFSTFNGGSRDGYVFKMNTNCQNLLWATYIGGSADDGLYGICFGKDSVVTVCGGTRSNNLPTHSTALHTTWQGNTDGFIAQFQDTLLTRLTYLGRNNYDQTYFVQSDGAGNIYVAGQTLSSTYPVIGTVYSEPNGGHFITKLNPNLSAIMYSTRFGTPGVINISLSAFLVDKCEQLYVSGWGGGANATVGNTLGMTTTSNAIQATTDGQDFYLIVYAKDAVSLLYAGFFGGNNNLVTPSSGEHVDGGTSRFDKSGIVYQSVCAGCWGNSVFPATPGVWSTTNNSSNCNNAIFKLDFQVSSPVIIANMSAAPSTGCAPLTVNFTNTSINGINYYWHFGDGGNSTTPNPTYTYTTAGTYMVMLIVENPSSCNVRDTAYLPITVHPLPSVPTHLVNDCDGVAVLDAGNPGSTYAWTYLGNPVGNTQTITVTSSGVYYVTITTPFGCVRKDSIVLNFHAPPTATAPPDTSTCSTQSIVLVGNATGAVSVQWLYGSSVVSTTNTYTANLSGMYIFQATNSVGCTAQDTVWVTYKPSPVDSLPPNITACTGTDIILDAKNIGSTYLWSIGGTPVSTNQIYSPTVSGQYVVEITNSFGCKLFDTVNVTILPAPDIIPLTDVNLCDSSAVTFNPTVSGATNYTWYYNGVPIGTTSSITVNNPGMYIFQASNGVCTDADTVMVQFYAMPKDSLPRTLNVCQSTPIILDAKNAGSTYSWYAGSVLVSNNQVYSPTVGGQYIVQITNSFGCTLTDTVQVNIVPLPTINLVERDTICKQGSVFLDAQGSPIYTYQWYKNGLPISHNFDTLTVRDEGLYVIEATNQGCAVKDSIRIFRSVPKAGLGGDTCVCIGSNVILTAKSQGMQYVWMPNGQTTQSIEVSQTGLYQVTVSSLNGRCTDTDQVYVTFVDCSFAMPNVFTPNADGKNDVFEYDVTGWKSYHLEIYNRWGGKVFETNEIGKFWNGKKNNTEENMPEGVYYGVIEAENCAGGVIKKAFNVTLFR